MNRSALAVAASLLAIAPRAATAGARSWLDRSPPANWNGPGAKVPPAPAPAGDLPTAARCRGGVARPPENAIERQVTAAGWTLFGGAEKMGRTRMVSGCTSVDGMCRPLGYQVFVFVDGKFSGTLAPRPMDARTDGSANRQRLLSPEAVSAEFSRYSATDALCCPSRVATVLYRVRQADGGPLVVPTSILTVPEAPSGAGSCGAPPTASAPGAPGPSGGPSGSCGQAASPR